MKHFNLCIILLLILSLPVRGQVFPTVAKVNSGSGSGSSGGIATVYDKFGNKYVAGYAFGTVNPDNTGATSNYTITVPGSNATDIFIAKYNSTGSLVWAFSAGGPTAYNSIGYDQPTGIAVDDSGYVYLIGYVNATTADLIDMDPSSGVHNVSGVYAGGGQSMLAAKYDGKLLPSNTSFYKWAFTFGGTVSGVIGIDVDDSGYVYLTGSVGNNGSSSVIDMDPSSGVHNVNVQGANDLFVAKYDGKYSSTSTLFYKWAFTLGCGASNVYGEQGNAIAVDDSGFVYITGYVQNCSTDMDPNTSNAPQYLTAPAPNTLFGAKYDGKLGPTSTTFYKWAFTFGTNSNSYGNCIAVDDSGYMYVGGYAYTATNGSNIILAKYNAKLTPASALFKKWSFMITGSTTQSFGPNSSATGIAVDKNGNVFVTGFISGNTSTLIDMDPSSNTHIISGTSATAGSDIFVAKYNGNLDTADVGFYQWAFAMGGATNNDAGRGIALDDSTFSVCGSFLSGTGLQNDFQPGSNVYNLASQNSGANLAAFLATYREAPPLKTDSIQGSPFCAGAAVKVPFTTNSVFVTGNVFTAQLSDAAGSFTAPVNIGTLSGVSSDTILATIPVNTVNGTGYRIRVVSSTPVIVGTDNGVNLTINALLVPAVTINVSPNDTICAGTAVTFTAIPVNPGTAPSYVWKKNSLTVGSNSASYNDNRLADGDMMSLTLTSNATCASPASANSNVIAMKVNPILTPSLTISASPGDTICVGTAVTFTTLTSNAGNAPTYVWEKGGTIVGGNTATYTDNGLVNGDMMSLTLTSNATCANTTPVTSNSITMTVNPIVTPDVIINVSPDDTICSGAMVTFTATSTNAGAGGIYQWRKNGITVGNNNTAYSSNAIRNNDVIYCIMGSSMACVTNTKDSSNEIAMTVYPTIPPAIVIASSKAGGVSNFRATASNAGLAPIFQWRKNGVMVGANSSVYSDGGLVMGDTVTCTVYSSLPCSDPDSAISNKIGTRHGLDVAAVAGVVDLTLYPNPNNGAFNLEGKMVNSKEAIIEIYTIVGQLVYQQKATVIDELIKEQIQLTDNNANGVYLLRVRTDNGAQVIRFVKE